MIISSINYTENKGIKCINKAVTMSSLGQGPLGMNAFRDGSFRHGQGGCSSEEMALVWEG